MEIILFVGKSKDHLNYYTDLFITNGIQYETGQGYLGYNIKVNVENTGMLAECICRFILDFYLKEAVISKIYDEYPCFNTQSAGNILTEISKKIINTPIKTNIEDIINDKKAFNPESYSIFNLKTMMICVYGLTDHICNNMMYESEKNKLVSLIKVFSKLSFDKCESADVEFADDRTCIISIDKKDSVSLSDDELLPFLTEISPLKITIKNPLNNPELAGIVTEIFNFEKK